MNFYYGNFVYNYIICHRVNFNLNIYTYIELRLIDSGSTKYWKTCTYLFILQKLINI